MVDLFSLVECYCVLFCSLLKGWLISILLVWFRVIDIIVWVVWFLLLLFVVDIVVFLIG